MLEIIFKAREEKLASLTVEDKNYFKVHTLIEVQDTTI